ncbi:MAG: hypothetical protein OEZ10_08785 [Gammaproteobacteria bacterium]|nr:hypothetical protein [Gammaproteobacteria bacterium]
MINARIPFRHMLAILVATLLTQWHGIKFWSGLVGTETGWAWSLALEGAALWLWAHRERRRVFAVIASGLLLAGPLFHIAEPLIVAAETAETASRNRAQSIEITRAEIETLEAALARSLANSAARLGWLGDIQASKAELSTARARLRDLVSAQAPSVGFWAAARVIMQALALVIVWLVSVMAIIEITKPSAGVSTQAGNTAPARPAAAKSAITVSKSARPPEADELVALAELSSRALDALLANKGITQGEWSEQKGLSPKNVSLVKNHAQRKAEGKEVASEATIRRVAAALGVSVVNKPEGDQ